MNENLNEQREVSQIKEKLAGEKFLNRFSNIKTWCKEQELFELNTPLFWLGLMLKIFAIVLFVPPMMEKFFVPFVEVFAQNVFSNPYEKFYLTGPIDAFPYSSIMLWLYAFPSALMAKIAPGVTESLPLMRFFWPRLTILLADFVILISLRALLPAHRRRMIGFWWLSPIAGYICYIHGQLDVLPTAALLVSLLLLFGNRQLSAYLVLGIGIAMKAHLLAALPFICIFSYLSLRSWWRVALLALISLCLYGLLQIPYMSDGFIQMVFLEKQSLRLFELSYPFGGNGRLFLFAPAVVLFLFLRYASLKTSNKDTLLLILGLLFAALVSVVPPTTGWFLWSLPFLVYFFAKYPEASKLSYYIYLTMYVAYQLVEQGSDIPHAVAFWFPNSSWTTVFEALGRHGIDAQRVENIVFTGLEASLVMNILWIYRVGISSSNLVRRLKQNFRIGVCGDSGSGKSTATDVLVDLFGKKNTLVVAGDDLHKWERGDSNWQKFTHLDPKSNRLHVDVDHAEKLMTGQMVSRSNYDHVTGMFTPACSIESNRVMIFQGLHTFFLPRMRNLLHLKVFFDPDRNLRYTWKIHRDQKKRGYSKEQVLEQLAKREPDAVKYIESQRLHADIVVRYLPVQPDLSLEAMLVMASVPIKIQLQLTADLDVENLVAALVSSESLSCEYWYDTSLGKVVLECVGDISVDRVRAIAPKLATLYEEIIGTDPCWQGGYSGVLQLIVLQYMTYFYSHSSQGMRT